MEERTVLITGASRGLGLALVKAFARDGTYKVVAVTRNGESLKEQIGSSDGSRVVIIPCSITEETGRAQIANTLETLPALRCVIHNAGKLLFKPFENINSDELHAVYEVNVFAPFLLTQTLMPYMDNTHSIYISSVGGVEGSVKFSGLSGYSTSKAALNCLTEMLSEEYKDTGNSFNCLALGSVDTEMFREAFPGVVASSTVEEMADYIHGFAESADAVMRGKIISISKSNP